jgi:hypothetical protein
MGRPCFNLFFFFFFWWNWSLNSGLCTCKAGALPFQPQLQSILLWLSWRWSLKLFARLASNHDPFDLSLQVAKIIPVSHWCLAHLAFLNFRNQKKLNINFKFWLRWSKYTTAYLPYFLTPKKFGQKYKTQLPNDAEN